MARLRRVLPGVLTAGALLAAATTCLTLSYAGAPTSTGVAVAAQSQAAGLAADRAVPLGGKEEEEEEKREELENESEKNQYAERAERAREQTERDSEQQKSSQTAEDRSTTAIVRAQMELIGARDPASGAHPDPCVHSAVLPPGLGKIELRLSKPGEEGAGAEMRTLAQVGSPAGCSSLGGFVLEAGAVPARLVLCPSSCAWARTAPHGLRADVLFSDL